MRKFIKYVCFILALAVLAAVLPAIPAAADDGRDYKATVYVGNATGSDSNAGTSPDKAVKTLGVAYTKLSALMGSDKTNPEAYGRIVLVDDLSFTGDSWSYGTKNVYTAVITGATPEKAFRLKPKYFNVPGPAIFENMTFIHESDTNLRFFCACGNKVTIGENVTCVPNANGYNYCLVGGSYYPGSSNGATDLTVNSGSWRSVYAGNYACAKSTTTSGSARLTINGGEVAASILPSYSSPVKGDLTVNINGGTVGTLSLAIGKKDSTDVISVSGDINVTAGDCAINKTGTPDCGGEYTLSLFASEGKTLQLGGTEINAASFTGGGTLKLGGDAMATFGSVTGETEVVFTSDPAIGTHIKAPADTPDAAFTCAEHTLTCSSSGGDKVWNTGGEISGARLTVSAPAGTELEVYTGFKDGEKITPAGKFSAGDTVEYVYTGLASGNYRYQISGDGFYSVKKQFKYTKDTEMTMNADPGRHSGAEGFDQRTFITEYSDGVLEGPLASAAEMFGEYSRALCTPAFTNTENRPRHQITTQDEMMSYIRALDDADDNMYLFILGNTATYGYEFPLVVFTKADLSGAKTVEEAAAIIRADTEKPVIHYEAQMHATEPAGGEGALAMIKELDGDRGESVLDSVNIYVMPRLNPEGAKVFQRRIVSYDIDINSDNYYQQSKEMQFVHKAYNLFAPHVVIDAHEYEAGSTESGRPLDDVYIGFHGNPTATERNEALMTEMGKYTGDHVTDTGLGLRPFYYPEGGANSSIRAYSQNNGSLGFLIETRGIEIGRNCYERRVVSQFVAVEGFINFTVQNAQRILDTVNATRSEYIAGGRVYDDDDIIIIKRSLDTTQKIDFFTRHYYSMASGAEIYSADPRPGTTYKYNIVQSRRAATAYLIPLGETYSEEVKTQLAKNGVEYYTIAPGSAVKLTQYLEGEAGGAADVSTEKTVYFENGAIVAVSAQLQTRTLGLLMEPRILDNSGKISLVMQGIISPADGAYPIYRYERDLEPGDVVLLEGLRAAPEGLTVHDPQAIGETGGISGLEADKLYEYGTSGGNDAATVTGVTEITGLKPGNYFIRYAATETESVSESFTFSVKYGASVGRRVYIDGVSGSDGNSGYTEQSPVKTLSAAYAALDALMVGAAAEDTGEIVILGTVTVDADFTGPATVYGVHIYAKNADKGIDSAKNFHFNGRTEISDLTLNLTSAVLRFICGGGKGLTIGENVTCTGKTSGSDTYYYCLAGGSYSKATAAAASLTVLSGTWRNVYVANYSGSFTGSATLTAKNCTIARWVQTGLKGTANADISVELTNVKGILLIYGGVISENGVVNGNVDITLNKGTEAGKVYAGTHSSGTVNGTVTVTQNGADIAGITDGQSPGGRTTDVERSVLIIKSGSLPGGYDHFDEVKDLTAAIPGDLDGDGEVTDSDAVYLLFYTFFPDDYPVTGKADFDGDGEITDNDAVYLLFYTFFPEDYPIN